MPGVHVLVADDYGDSREILNIILDAEGYRTTLAADGAEALEKAQQDPPDIILMDVFMPILDGLAATQALKANEQLSRIPVIAYTAKPTDIEGHRDLFFDVLAKPCDPDRLLTVLRRASATPGGSGCERDGLTTPSAESFPAKSLDQCGALAAVAGRLA